MPAQPSDMADVRGFILLGSKSDLWQEGHGQILFFTVSVAGTKGTDATKTTQSPAAGAKHAAQYYTRLGSQRYRLS